MVRETERGQEEDPRVAKHGIDKRVTEDRKYQIVHFYPMWM